MRSYRINNSSSIGLFWVKLVWYVVSPWDLTWYDEIKGDRHTSSRSNDNQVVSFNVSLISLTLVVCVCVCWFVEWMRASGRDSLRRSPCFFCSSSSFFLFFCIHSDSCFSQNAGIFFKFFYETSLDREEGQWIPRSVRECCGAGFNVIISWRIRRNQPSSAL